MRFRFGKASPKGSVLINELGLFYQNRGSGRKPSSNFDDFRVGKLCVFFEMPAVSFNEADLRRQLIFEG